ncbi:hypothetical protein LXA43DRAFT_1067644 [Ganoderma leucocontextum]|nr:hypothetical protein LXA43DRAFT_1067644 [Ganoderma leucocontextum]
MSTSTPPAQQLSSLTHAIQVASAPTAPSVLAPREACPILDDIEADNEDLEAREDDEAEDEELEMHDYDEADEELHACHYDKDKLEAHNREDYDEDLEVLSSSSSSSQRVVILFAACTPSTSVNIRLFSLQVLAWRVQAMPARVTCVIYVAEACLD